MSVAWAQQEALIENAKKTLPGEVPNAPYVLDDILREEVELRARKDNAKVINTQWNERNYSVSTQQGHVNEGAKKLKAMACNTLMQHSPMMPAHSVNRVER